MSATDALYRVAYYARDLTAVAALGAAIVLVILGFTRASRGVGLRSAVTAVGFLALLAATILSTVSIDRAFFLTRLVAVQVLVASVIVWLFSMVIQGYYGA